LGILAFLGQQALGGGLNGGTGPNGDPCLGCDLIFDECFTAAVGTYLVKKILTIQLVKNYSVTISIKYFELYSFHNCLINVK